MYDNYNYRVRYKNRKISATEEKLTKRHANSTILSKPISDEQKKQSREKLHNLIKKKQALIYRIRKLDFCEADLRRGIVGTKKRELGCFLKILLF